jgi:mono/diheme cytochrome c family protein
MKKKIITKTLASAFLLFIYACGGSGDNSAGSTSQTQSQTTQAPAATSEAPVDIRAKSDSKGIGKFTSVTLEPVSAEKSKQGEAIFSTQCISCHKLSDERLIGPGLKGITEIRTPEWILNMITNPEQNVQKDPLGKALLAEYKAVMPYQGITEENARAILDYLRQNDSK